MFAPLSLILRFTAALLVLALPTISFAQTAVLPAGTSIYGELDEQVTSKKKHTTVGDIVRARVWRDVLVEGRVVIKAGSPLVTRVSHVKPAKIAGRKGEVFLDAISATAVDGTEILLDGGYDKSGKGRKALSWSLFALVAWPLIFIKGKQAVLDPGTVFDAAVQSSVEVAVESGRAFPIRLGPDGPSLTVTIIYDEIDAESKQKILPVIAEVCRGTLESAGVVTVNGKEIPRIPVVLSSRVKQEECEATNGTIDLEALAKHFTKGINRFEVEAAEGLVAEVLLEIEL